MSVVINNCAYTMVHVPDFVRFGSKPIRDIEETPSLEPEIRAHIRTFAQACGYPPNQVFIGNRHPDWLNSVPKPWYENGLSEAPRTGPFGEIMPEEEFYGWLKMADEFDLVWLEQDFLGKVREAAGRHPFVSEKDIERMGQGVPMDKIMNKIEGAAALPLLYENRVIGSLRRDHDKDDSLKAHVLMENLLSKASAALTMHHLFRRSGIAAGDIDFILDCSETAVGDRYNRGGGSLSKAIGEMVGCRNATGCDIKAFCAAPIHALIMAAGLVESGIFGKVAVVGGGCLSKIGMKYAAHIKHDMPILEDMLAGIAFLVAPDDGVSPVIRLDCVGKHDIAAGSSQESIMTSLVLKPLSHIGRKITDIERFSTELHNPEITLPAGSGNTPLTNYRIIAALAARNGEIDRTEIDKFVLERGMPGYSPTQGHIPAAVPFIGHVLEPLKKGELSSVMFVAKGSLFLGRMSQLADGMSFLLEKNPKAA